MGEDTPGPRSVLADGFSSIGGLMMCQTSSSSNLIAGNQYRLNSPARAIMDHEGQHLRLTIPLDDVVQVVDRRMTENWLLEVKWKGRALTIFKRDLYECGELVA